MPAPSATPSPTPDGDVGGGEEGTTCTDPGESAGTGATDSNNSPLPDTASLERTARVVGANAFPLGLLTALAIAAGWCFGRRRRNDDLEPVAVEATAEPRLS